MKIRLWPDFIGPKTGSVKGDKITLDGKEFDLSPLKQGQRLPLSAIDSDHFIGTEYAERVDGEINLAIRMRVDWDSPQEYMNPPEPIVLSVSFGAINFPDTSPVKEESAGVKIND